MSTVEELEEDELMSMVIAGFQELARRQEVPILHVVDECREQIVQELGEMGSD